MDKNYLSSCSNHDDQNRHESKLDSLQVNHHRQLSRSRAPMFKHHHPAQETAFLKRFALQDVHESGHFTSLPVYREKPAILDSPGDSTPVENPPTIQCLIYYDIVLSRLSVHLHHLSNLKSPDKSHQSVQCDLSVAVQLLPDKEVTFQSQVVSTSHRSTCAFNEIYQFERLSPDYVKLLTLVFRVYNHVTKQRVCLGVAYLPLCDAELFGAVMQMILNADSESEVCVCLRINMIPHIALYRIS